MGTQLPNVLEIYEVPYHNFTHFDFIMAKDIVKLCNKRVVELIENAQNDVWPNKYVKSFILILKRSLLKNNTANVLINYLTSNKYK